MKISTTVKADMSGVAAKIDKICKSKSLGMFAASEAARMMRPYVPELDSILIDSTSIKPFQVTYNTPYAHYQWEGRRIKNRTKAGSRSHWEQGINVVDLANAITAYLAG